VSFVVRKAAGALKGRLATVLTARTRALIAGGMWAIPVNERQELFTLPLWAYLLAKPLA
jgi:hypothetical protein